MFLDRRSEQWNVLQKSRFWGLHLGIEKRLILCAALAEWKKVSISQRRNGFWQPESCRNSCSTEGNPTMLLEKSVQIHLNFSGNFSSSFLRSKPGGRAGKAKRWLGKMAVFSRSIEGMSVNIPWLPSSSASGWRGWPAENEPLTSYLSFNVANPDVPPFKFGISVINSVLLGIGISGIVWWVFVLVFVLHVLYMWLLLKPLFSSSTARTFQFRVKLKPTKTR